MTLVFGGQITALTTTAVPLSTAFPTALARCKRIVFSAQSATAMRIQIQTAAGVIVREINPTPATGPVDEHVTNGGGEWVNTARLLRIRGFRIHWSDQRVRLRVETETR